MKYSYIVFNISRKLCKQRGFWLVWRFVRLHCFLFLLKTHMEWLSNAMQVSVCVYADVDVVFRFHFVCIVCIWCPIITMVHTYERTCIIHINAKTISNTHQVHHVTYHPHSLLIPSAQIIFFIFFLFSFPLTFKWIVCYLSLPHFQANLFFNVFFAHGVCVCVWLQPDFRHQVLRGCTLLKKNNRKGKKI